MAASHLAVQSTGFDDANLPELLQLVGPLEPENSVDGDDQALKAAAESFCGTFQVTLLYDNVGLLHHGRLGTLSATASKLETGVLLLDSFKGKPGAVEGLHGERQGGCMPQR